MQKTVSHNQNLFDFAVQHCGTIQAAIDIAKLNNISLTASLVPGQALEVPNRDYGYSDIVEYFIFKKQVPATAIQVMEGANEENYLLPQIFPMQL